MRVKNGLAVMPAELPLAANYVWLQTQHHVVTC